MRLPAPRILALLLVLLSTGSQAQEPLESRVRAIAEELDAKREEMHVAGAALAVVKDDQIILLKGFGLRDVENRLAVTPNTLFAIGSSSKAFTALTVQISADEGKLRLSDPPRKYLPQFRLQDPDADSRITIGDLLSHRSGLNRTDLAWYTGKLKPAEILRVAAEAKPTAKFGEKFQYQNVMYMAAGEIVAKVHKVSWPAFVSRRVLKPLGMLNSNLSVPVTVASPDHAVGYVWDNDAKKQIALPMRDLAQLAPAGGINSTATDMAQWVRFMLNGGAVNGRRLVSETGFAGLTDKRIDIGPGAGYGYGWFLREWNGHKVVEHGGNIDGFSAQVALMPDQKLGLVLLTNAEATPLVRQAMDIVWKHTVGAPPKAAASAAATSSTSVPPDKEVGKYLLAVATMTFEVVQSDGALRMLIPGQPTATLVPVGGRRYKLTGPFPEGFFITFRESKADPAAAEALLEQPQGNVVLVKQKDIPFQSPISVEELMKKQVEALGGEAALRAKKSMALRFRIAMEDQGITGNGIEWYGAPRLHAQQIDLLAAGKKIAVLRDYCDGKQAGTETTFGRPALKTGSSLQDEVVEAALWPALEWKTLYKSVAIVRMDKVNGEEVYVVEKKSPGGRSTVDYVSARSFLTLKTETSGTTQSLADYREVLGVKIPFSRIVNAPTGSRNVVHVTEVKFNVPVAPGLFRPSSLGGRRAFIGKTDKPVGLTPPSGG